MKRVVKNTINLICIIGLIYGGTGIYYRQVENQKAQGVMRKIKEEMPQLEKQQNVSTAVSTQGNQEMEKEGVELDESEYKRLKSINQDYRGWIKVEGTNIDYPVLQGEDNTVYLERDVFGEKLLAGSIFMDYRNDLSKDSNVIIYGHNMRNKTMFNQIEKFKEKDFFEENNKITLEVEEGTRVYEVFAVYVTYPEDDYRQTKFEDERAYGEYLKKVRQQSLYESKIQVTNQDQIVTLSTCSYEFDDARTVVHAKRIK